ncbi:MAG TPA: hypothetical protein VGB22_09480 [candidate division Zixibacteria bacterium]
MTDERYAVHIDYDSQTTSIYIGAWINEQVIIHQIDSALTLSSRPLAVPWGQVLLAEDLDGDGQIELILQRGDGFNGFLDILSAPDWQPRGHFVFPGMNIEMYPVAIDLDSDSALELYTLASDWGFNARAVVIDFSAIADTFEIISDITAPQGSVGSVAAADFDNDGRVEFINGNGEGYGLLEWQDSTLAVVGQIPGQVAGHWAAVCRPFPGGVPCAILGSFRGDLGFTHSLLQATGNNQFAEVKLFQQSTGWGGPSQNYAADIDCDGLDEMVLEFFPEFQVWEWDPVADSFVQSCVWDFDTYGNLYRQWDYLDLDQNGVLEFSNVKTGQKQFRAFPGNGCVNCDPSGNCVPPPVPCVCVCHGDPSCDGVRADVFDVVKSVDVAFRSSPEQNDPGPQCNRAQTDVNCDGVTNVFDVVKFVDVAFRSANPAVAFCDPCVE